MSPNGVGLKLGVVNQVVEVFAPNLVAPIVFLKELRPLPFS